MSETSAAKTPHPWSSDSLFAKAQRYAEEMLSHDRDDWRFAFWSTLTLELLARAALAHVSSALLADSKDWTHLYFADRIRTQGTKICAQVYRHLLRVRAAPRNSCEVRVATRKLRCSPSLPTKRRARTLGGTPFDSIAAAEWLPLFYEACEILISRNGREHGDAGRQGRGSPRRPDCRRR